MSEINDNANRILQRLRECKTPDEVEVVANEERKAVLEMNQTAEGKTLVIHIVNLKAYLLDFKFPRENGREAQHNER